VSEMCCEPADGVGSVL